MKAFRSTAYGRGRIIRGKKKKKKKNFDRIDQRVAKGSKRNIIIYLPPTIRYYLYLF